MDTPVIPAPPPALVLGPLFLLGPQQPWEAALLLPDRWDDLRRPIDRFDFSADADGAHVLLCGRIGCEPPLFERVPRMQGFVQDAEGRRVGFTVFGDSRGFVSRLRAAPEPMLYGTLKHFHGRWWLTGPQIIADPRWVGRLRPVYPGAPRVIAPETVRARMLALLHDAIPEAARRIDGALRPLLDGDPLLRAADLESLLWDAHLPDTEDAGRRAQGLLERLAALVAVAELRRAAGAGPAAAFRARLDWRPRASRLPFALTGEQVEALEAIAADLAGERPMRRLLNGETGSGKTAVFLTAAAACVDGGGRVAVLTPNARLAEQACEVVRRSWPDLDAALVTAENGAQADLARRRLVIGTTALLHRDCGRFALVVVDEQQKFSREQREQLAAGGAHLLEVSATPIPRSQALMRYGALAVSRLRQGHVAKRIETRIWVQAERRRLFAAVQETIRQGHQVIVVYPRREAAEETGASAESDAQARAERLAAAKAHRLWDRLMPGRVALAHGGLEEADNAGAMAQLREGRADLLVATTVVEVGIDLPRVRRVVVVHPQYLGLTQLHQIRGRIARTGGQGWFDLYLPEAVGDKSMERLSALTQTSDGFRIAEMDLRLRGAGELRSDGQRQWGADESLLFGRPLRLDLMDAILAGERE